MRIENSFIPVRGIGETTERRLWETGITHWDEFDDDVVDRSVPIGSELTNRIRNFITDGRRHLESGDVSAIADAFPSDCRWRLYENFKDETCFLDIETTGLDARVHDVTTVSIHQAGTTETLIADRSLSSETLQTALDEASLLVTFNGARFDVPFLETNYDVSVTTPHVDLMYPCRQLGLSGGLKAIERELGIERTRPDISGREAVRLWHAYERGDERALETLVEYNRADTKNLRPLMDTVANSLSQRVFESVCRTE